MTSKAKGCSVLLLVRLPSPLLILICQALGWNFLIGGGALEERMRYSTYCWDVAGRWYLLALGPALQVS